MNLSLLCGWFQDWGLAIREGLGNTGLVVMLVIFGSLALMIAWNILKASLGKTKVKILWGQIFILVVIILFIVWFATLI